MSKLKDILFYWPEFFIELKLLIKYAKAVKGLRKELGDAGVRVDWIGRLYCIIELTDDVAQQQEVFQQSVVFQSLKPVNDILMKYGLSDISFPTIQRINKGNSYLVILYPEHYNLNLWSILKNTAFWVGLVYLIKYAIQSIPTIQTLFI